MRWKIADKRGAATVFAALLEAGLFEGALLHDLRPKEREIRARASEASEQLLVLLQAGRL
jgi:hypothetical protein